MIDGFIVLYCSTDSRPPMRSYPYCYFTFNFIADSLVYLSGCNEDAMSRNKCHFFGLEFIFYIITIIYFIRIFTRYA